MKKKSHSTETPGLDNTPEGSNQELSKSGVARRGLLKGAALLGATTGVGLTSTSAMAAGGVGSPVGEVLADDPLRRAANARLIKFAAANTNFLQSPRTEQPINDDESRFDDFRGNFHKTLQHNALAEVQRESYLSFLNALDSRDPDDFEDIIVGRPDDPLRNRLVSPQAAFAFELSGKDGNSSRVPPAPAVDSATTEAEMAELYWYSVTRDVPFADYATTPIIQRAADDLSAFSRREIFPMDASGNITPDTLFRGKVPVVGTADGVLNGPFVTQFLTLPFQQGQLEVNQLYRQVRPGTVNQFMTRFDEFLRIQNGFDPNARAANGNATTFDNRFRYLFSMRQLSEWVHRDFPVESPLFAFSVLLGLNDDLVWDQNLPYLRSASNTQQGFTSYGVADMLEQLTLAPRQGLTAAWFQKWACHRRVRPEEYGGLINVQSRGERDYNLGSELLASEAYRQAIAEVRRVNGNRRDPSNDGLLPMGYPEGCPAHPSYPGGHSTFVSAGATVIKGFVNEDFIFPNPQMTDSTGENLVPYTATPLTLGGELNKLVANVTHARDGAGMHWRSDGVGNIIGEAVGIALLADYSRSYNEEIDGLTLTKFDGTKILIKDGRVTEI